LPRNAQKRTLKKSQEKKSRMVGGWVWDLANVRGGPSIFFWAAPRGLVVLRFGRLRAEGSAFSFVYPVGLSASADTATPRAAGGDMPWVSL
jgi:hypothetical protein